MLDLLTPEAHEDAYIWAAAFLAHFSIGLGLTAVTAAIVDWWSRDWIIGTGWMALTFVAAGFFLIWEGMAQGYGAGMLDAALDTTAVALGGLAGVSAWLRWAGLLAWSIILTAIITAAGVLSRRK